MHKCVEDIEEIPKLKLFIGKDKKRTRAPYEFLQEFQYLVMICSRLQQTR